MPHLIINLTESEHALLLQKSGDCDLQQITRIALDNYFCTHRHTATNTVPLDLSGRGKVIAALEADRIDPRKPVPPTRHEIRIDTNRPRYETDADFEKAMSAYRWNLDRYNAEKAAFEAKRSKGVINEWGGISCTL